MPVVGEQQFCSPTPLARPVRVWEGKQMNRKAIAGVVLAGTLAVGTIAGSAVAGGHASNEASGAHGGTAKAVGGATAPNAKIAAFINQGGAVNWSKGITAATHPSTGLYCLNPKDDSFNPNRAVPSVSVDWSTSLGDALMAQWRSSGIGCPAGWLSVLTFDGEDGSFDLSNSVSFTMVVP